MANSDGLNRMNKLLEILGSPEKDFKVFHIAGTNGKGSTAYIIASVLEQSGYSVGLYTSPHLEEYYERIQIWNGKHEMVSNTKFDALEKQVLDAAMQIKELGDLHIFEKLTAIAYLFFKEQNPDYVVLECGLGGRLDSTNTIEKPLVSVITEIGLDHTQQLGKTIYKVAREKAGIIKAGVPVVTQTKDTNIKKIFKDTANELGSEWIDSSEVRSKFKKYELGMLGMYQYDNAASAVTAIKSAGIELSDEAISTGLKLAFNPGRFEILKENPYIIVDGAHNLDAIKACTLTIKNFIRNKGIKKYIIVIGCMQDKNYHSMIRHLCTEFNTCDFAALGIDDKRSANPLTLGECFVNNGRSCTCYDNPEEALTELSKSDYECVIFIGSIYLAGAVRKIFLKERV